MTNNPLITIIIPVYKVEKYIDKCIKSVLNQSYKNLEIILVDDGTPDNSGKICDEYAKNEKRIKVIHKKNGGLSDARNKGLENATGKYITFLDSDDYIEPNYISCHYKNLKENDADISIASHNVIYENGKGHVIKTCGFKVLNKTETLERMLYDDGINVSTWNKLYKKELFKDIKFPVNRLFEDVATTYKLIDKANKIVVIEDALYNYFVRNNSITTSEFNPKKMDLIISTKEMCEYIEKKYPNLKSACERRILYAYLSILSQIASANEKNIKEKDECLKYIKQNSKKVLHDKKIPKRDKIALLTLKGGYRSFAIFWNGYRKVSGRK